LQLKDFVGLINFKLFSRARTTMAPAPGGVSLNVGGLMTPVGQNNTGSGGYTCIHSRNAGNDVTGGLQPMSTTPPAANTNHADHRIFSAQLR